MYSDEAIKLLEEADQLLKHVRREYDSHNVKRKLAEVRMKLHEAKIELEK